MELPSLHAPVTHDLLGFQKSTNSRISLNAEKVPGCRFLSTGSSFFENLLCIAARRILHAAMMSPLMSPTLTALMSPSLRSPSVDAEKTDQMQQLEEASDGGEVAREAIEEATEESWPEEDPEKALGLDEEGKSVAASSNFGETMVTIALSPSEVHVLRQSFDFLLASMGHDREAVGDAIYGLKITALAAIKESFTTPRAVVSLRFFNCFRLLLEKVEHPDELKIYVETLAFKHMGNEVTELRVDKVIDGFNELLINNVPDLPPGTGAAWRQILTYCGSCYKFVCDSYGERLRVIKEDWAAIQASGSKEEKTEGDEETVKEEEKAEEAMEAVAEGEEAGAETFSFARMCAFSCEVMGQRNEAWMDELLKVFHECDLLAINLITKSQSIDFEKFKPVMLAALRSLLPKQWSTLHENAWEWLWTTVARNLNESTMKVRAFKPFNVKLFTNLTEDHLDRFRVDIFTAFFARSTASQDLFKQSQSRLRYIADRVLQSSADMFQKNKDDTLDDLSALGLRHVGYGIPIELFGPFADCCVEVMLPLIQEMPNDCASKKMMWCPKDRAHQLPEKDLPEHMMLEGFRWSISLTARVLVRTIMDGSTAVMQAIHFDDSKRLHRALQDAPRAERSVWQLAVQVGSQSISPLFWALRSGAHAAAKTMIEDVLTIRADRDNYYYGVDQLFKYQPNIADNILREAPFLAETLLNGLIWRSHKSQDNWRPVIYYLKHMLQDMDEEKMLSRALISYVHFNHPQTIMHPILAFSLDLLWENLALRFFLMDRVLTVFNCIMFILAECYLNQASMISDPTTSMVLFVARCLVYTLGFFRLVYWHTCHVYKAYRQKATTRICGLVLPQYLCRGSAILSFLIMVDLLCMLTVEPMVHCLGSKAQVVSFQCEQWTDEMSLLYEMFVVVGLFLYMILILELGSISIKFSEYRVLCLHAMEQVLLCFGVVFLTILSFAFAISGMANEVSRLTNAAEWQDVSAILSTLVRLAFGAMDLGIIEKVCVESPLLIIVIVLFMMLVYSFFFNLLVSQFCGVYTSLAADIKGHARLARGEIIIETFKAVKLSRWQKFMNSMHLDQKVDFEQGDIGLAGGIKTYEPALAHPIAKDQIVRFGGRTEGHLPWPEKNLREDQTIERTIQKTPLGLFWCCFLRSD
eukprot:s702_g11.t1